MATFVDGNVTSKRFPQVGVEAFFIAMGAAAAKCDRMEHGGRIFHHEIKCPAMHTLVHCLEGGVVVGRLAGNVAKNLALKVFAKDKHLVMVILPQAWIFEDGMAHIIECRSGFRTPHSTEHCSVVLAQKLAERCYSDLKIWNETRVELQATL